MATQKRSALGRIEIGFGLLSFTVVLVVIAVLAAFGGTQDVLLRIVILAVAAAAIATLWVSAMRNGAVEREARRLLRERYPGSLVERVRLWSLPAGRVDADLPMHFVIADAAEIAFETVDRTALLRIPVDEIGFIGPVTAQGDRARDKALTIISGDEKSVVQLFTLTYAGVGALGARLRKAIGWPADGVPIR